VGDSSKGGVLEGIGVGEKGEVGVVGAVQDAKMCYHIMGISCGGGEVWLLEFLTLLE
jgi:hypothetical protein